MASNDEPVVLWTLGVHGREVRCLQQPSGKRFELRVLMGDEVFLTETFPDLSRLAARAEEFRTAIGSRGWNRTGTDDPPTDTAARPVGTTPPAGAETVGSGEAPTPAEGAGEPALPTVLVVDDEGAVRSFLRAYLEDAEYKVYEATDVDGALNTLDQARVDAVVLDVRMPDPRGLGRSGLEVLAFIRLRAAFDALPVMILTGRSLEPEEQEIIRRHRAYLFLKPDGYRQLLQRLEQLTTRPGTGRP
jgi:CheY-like chemotaxis protein